MRAVRAEVIKTEPRNAGMMSLRHLSGGEKEPPATKIKMLDLGASAGLGDKELLDYWGFSPADASQYPKRPADTPGWAQHSCFAAAFRWCSSSSRLGCADGPRETPCLLQLLSSGSAPIKLGFMGLP